MLVIRDAQLNRFAAEQMNRFEQRVFLHIQRWSPELAAQKGEAGLRPIIARSVERGRSFGLTAERQLALFTDVRIIAGEEFDSAHPDAVRILADRQLNGDEKIARLVAIVNDMPQPRGAGSPER